MNIPSIGSNFEISGYKSVQCTGNPNKDAKNFADANGLSVEEAKAVLSGVYGTPDQEPTLADGADFKPTGDPQEDLKTYADAKGFSLDDAKLELEELFGKPQVKEKSDTETTTTESTTENSLSEKQQQALTHVSTALGITLSGNNDSDIATLNDAFGKIKYCLYNDWSHSKYYICTTFGIDYSKYGSKYSAYIAASAINDLEHALAVLNGATEG